MDGSLDTSWGEGGLIFSTFPEGGAVPVGVAIDPASGKLVAGLSVSGDINLVFGAIRLEKDLVPPAQGAFRFSQVTYGVLENAGTATITVERHGGTTGAVSVNFAATAGSATAAADFSATSGTLNFANGDNSETFTVTILPDAIEEGQETIKLVLSNATGGALIDNPHNATLVIAGEATEAGLLDPSFGTGGFGSGTAETYPFLGNPGETAMARQSDGKLVVVASTDFSNGGARDWIIERFNVDGTLDATFGIGGTVLTDFFNSFDDARSVSILPDGKILVAGSAGLTANGAIISSVGLARYNSNGTIDTTFGELGKVARTIDFNSVLGAEVLVDGKIIVAGEILREVTNRGQPAFARFNADGSLDTTFGTEGVFTFPINGGDFGDAPTAFTVQPDGKIIVVGSTDQTGTNGDADSYLARVNANGTLDSSFGSQGKRIIDVGGSADDDVAFDVALQTDGRIVITGEADSKTFAARFTSSGAVDTTFDGTDGFILLTYPGSSTSLGGALAVQLDGKIVVAANVGPFSSEVGVARLNADGTLNTSFGLNGFTRLTNNSNDIDVGSLLVQPDGKAVLAGQRVDGSFNGHLFVARMLADPNEGALQFSAASFSVDENAGVGTVTVERIGGADGEVTVNFATSNGTAQAGSDFAATTGTLTFADKEVLKTFTVPLIDNNVLEGKESLTLTLSAPGGGAELAPRTTTTLTIFDGPGKIEFGQPEFYVGENFGTALITINRVEGSDSAVSVQFSTANATAKGGSDYTPVSVSVSFADGERSQTVAIPIFNDSDLEGLERVALSLSGPTGGAVLGRVTSAPLLLFDQETGAAHNPGALDVGWGGDGVVTTPFHTGNSFTDGFSTDLLVQADGRVVVAGAIDPDGDFTTNFYDIALVRYLADGTLDASFGGGDGKVIFDLGGIESVDRLFQVAGGKFLVVGSTLRDGKSDFAITRFNADGTVDTTFDTDGFHHRLRAARRPRERGGDRCAWPARRRRLERHAFLARLRHRALPGGRHARHDLLRRRKADARLPRPLRCRQRRRLFPRR